MIWVGDLDLVYLPIVVDPHGPRWPCKPRFTADGGRPPIGEILRFDRLIVERHVSAAGIVLCKIMDAAPVVFHSSTRVFLDRRKKNRKSCPEPLRSSLPSLFADTRQRQAEAPKLLAGTRSSLLCQHFACADRRRLGTPVPLGSEFFGNAICTSRPKTEAPPERKRGRPSFSSSFSCIAGSMG